MNKPYHIEKGTKPPARKVSDEEFHRAVDELEILVKENERLLREHINHCHSCSYKKLIEAVEEVGKVFDRMLNDPRNEGYKY